MTSLYMTDYQVIRAKNVAGTELPAKVLCLTESGLKALLWVKLGGTSESNEPDGYLDGQPIKIVGYRGDLVKVIARGLIYLLELPMDPLTLDYRLKSE